MNEDRSIEVTGEDVEQAVASGLEQLGVGPDDVMVEVLEEPARGMFGLGARPARVRLQLLTTPPPAPEASMIVAEEESPAQELEVVEDESQDEYEEPEPDSMDEMPAAAELYEGDLEEDAEVGKVVLAELLENMEIRAEVQVRRDEPTDEEEPPWMLDITGESDLSVLIGRKGETLASLQYITRLVTSRELQRRANIVVDVGGYKARRMIRLYALARRMADQATSMGRPVALEPMPPYERRIVHLALREREDVTTESSGEGEARKVNIIPAQD